MTDTPKRDFDKDASTWDSNPAAVERGRAVADTIIREVRPTADMDALDFGAGTGLVTLALQPYVKSITAADTSQGMLDVLDGKIASQGFTNVRTMLLDLETGSLPNAQFDLIVTSMVMHHLPDVPSALRAFHKMLRPGGIVAISDLDAEDGSFHPDNTGVYHFGFDRTEMKTMLETAGFRETRAVTAHVMRKEAASKLREFPIFLITAGKP